MQLNDLCVICNEVKVCDNEGAEHAGRERVAPKWKLPSFG